LDEATLAAITAVGLAPGRCVALAQALFTWARFEWDEARLKGTARHLWRMAADVGALHPDGPIAGGCGLVIL
jgi:hypothetical protein